MYGNDTILCYKNCWVTRPVNIIFVCILIKMVLNFAKCISQGHEKNIDAKDEL